MNCHNNAWGKDVIDRALEYANHEWYPTDKNVLHGLDCSGLLKNCWALTKKISTRDIPIVAKKIQKINEIRQGDIFAKIGSHVMLFVEIFHNDRNSVTIVDSTISIGKVSKRELRGDELINNGYEIYRKNELYN